MKIRFAGPGEVPTNNILRPVHLHERQRYEFLWTQAYMHAALLPLLLLLMNDLEMAGCRAALYPMCTEPVTLAGVSLVSSTQQGNRR